MDSLFLIATISYSEGFLASFKSLKALENCLVQLGDVVLLRQIIKQHLDAFTL